MTAYYTIQTLPGLSSDRSVLSCTPEGQVDLWKKDDGSGRQRWQMQGPVYDGSPPRPSPFN